MRKYLIGIITVLALLVLIIPGSHALALDPPDVISIYSVNAVRNTIEDGDIAIGVHFYVEDNDYETPASDTIIVRLMEEDGVTLIDSILPTLYFGYGYDNNACMFYFSASDNLTWGSEYVINIIGSPGFFTPAPEPQNYSMVAGDWYSLTDQELNQDDMETWVLSVARLLELAYPAYSLFGATDMGTALSSDGEAFFRQAMPGIQSIAPGIFLTQFYVPESIDMDLGTDQAEAFAETLDNSDLKDTLVATGEYIGMDWQNIAGGVIILICIAMIILTQRKGWGIHPGMIASSILLTAGAIALGDAFMAFRWSMALIAGILLMFTIFFKRS
jgi:hypothetical protein